ncbi:ABC transporter permease [Cumulibacter soli]|uniref:ABC transporter permease n=1 Tax=Cumulibacter soli TaxID=2546344 RepID=UPI0010679FBA|nr:ABC transporter permease [Cumulibacter soli]
MSGRSNGFAQVWQYRGLIGNFASRELKGRYKGSLLGSAWSLISPLATLLTYSIVFGFIMKFEPRVAGNGTLQSFPIYLFAALAVWNLFNSVALGSMGALLSAGPLLRKIYFPPFAPVLGSALAVLNQTAIEFGLLLAILLIVMNVGWSWLLLPVLLALWLAFSVGVGLILATINARFRDMTHIAGVLFGLLFYSAPIIYPVELVHGQYAAHPWLRAYDYNPITVFVEAFRNVVWDLRMPDLDHMIYMVVVSCTVLFVGWTYFQRRSADISEDL